jgi:hypothetical protein
MFSCPRCHGAIVVTGAGDVDSLRRDGLSGDVAKFLHGIETYPRRPPIDAPEHIPKEVHRLYVQACGCRQKGMRDAAGMAYRKTLELALKALSMEIDASLVKRIEKMAEQGRITSAMAEWANEIRLDGNKAAHDEEPTAEAVDQLHYFVHVFLLYAFTLPAMVGQRKNNLLQLSIDGSKNGQLDP